MNAGNVREIREAISAANNALISLEEARGALDSAKNWGIFDMIGGGFFGSMIKHGRMEDAGAAMERAKDDLYRLQSELRDIEVPMDFQVDVGGFLSFADMFLTIFLWTGWSSPESTTPETRWWRPQPEYRRFWRISRNGNGGF